MRRFSFVPVVVLAILFSGIVGVVIFRVAADQKPHSVLLKWNPPKPKPGTSVASYDVYRIQGDGIFVKIATGLTNPTYVDHDVSSGKTYRYFVRAIDSSGNVSPPSDQVTARIP